MSKGLKRIVSRREFLATTAGVPLAALAAGGLAGRRAAGQEDGPYGPFKMGLQSYSLRTMDRAAMFGVVEGLGLQYVETWAKHVPVTNDAAQMDGYREQLKAHGLEIIAAGVFQFDANEDSAKAILEFATDMGIPTVTANPTAEGLTVLGKLLEEYEVNIAIHNHGPGSPYDTIESVTRALDGRHERIGACVDTGWFIASAEDAVDAIRRFGERTYAVHVKDMTPDRQFTEVGKGELQVVPVLKALAGVDFEGILALEYEEHPDAPVPYIEECLEAIREVVKESEL